MINATDGSGYRKHDRRRCERYGIVKKKMKRKDKNIDKGLGELPELFKSFTKFFNRP